MAAAFVYGQDKPKDISLASPAQDEPTRTVEVNGVAEPVYRSGSKGITLPRPTYIPPPDYSEKARKRKIQGIVRLSVVVTSTGDTADVRVVKGLGYGLDEKAIEAVRRWKFQPATKDGKPVSVELAVDSNFHLY